MVRTVQTVYDAAASPQDVRPVAARGTGPRRKQTRAGEEGTGLSRTTLVPTTVAATSRARHALVAWLALVALLVLALAAPVAAQEETTAPPVNKAQTFTEGKDASDKQEQLVQGSGQRAENGTQEDDERAAGPLEGQTADITADSIGPIAVAGCEAVAGEIVSITIADADGTRQAFADDEDTVFQLGQQGITIAAEDGSELIFKEGSGSVVRSEGITCGDAAGSPPPNNGRQQNQEGGSCANPKEVAAIGPTTDNSVTPFTTTGRTFRVSYTVSGIDPDELEAVEIDIEGRFGLVDFATVEEDGSDSFVVTEEAGSYELVVNVSPQNSAEYTVTVEDCAGVDSSGNGDNIVNVPDDDLPNTGGVPLLALAVLGLVSAAAGLSVIREGRR